jgi:hypothetical protein
VLTLITEKENIIENILNLTAELIINHMNEKLEKFRKWSPENGKENNEKYART